MNLSVAVTLLLSIASADWNERVTAAKAMTDQDSRAAAMITLAREALAPLDVKPSGIAHSDQVNPEDNETAPVVNFDVRLNEKRSYATNGVVLEKSPAYYFVGRGKPYVVLGPNALDPRSPAFTRILAAHELFHARHHIGDPRPIEDRELETWTHVFVTHFHEIHPFKQRWAPLVSYYDQAEEGEQKAALDKLVAYYQSTDSIRTPFDEWLARREKDEKTASSKLVADLRAALAVK